MEANPSETPTPAAGPADASLSWSDLLAAYRVAPSDRWSAVLLDHLGPWLTNARKTLLEVPPVADAEDVAQQLVLEVLKIAARWRPRCEDQWIPRKLVEAAARRVRLSLRRERSARAEELDPRLRSPEAHEPELLLITPIGRATAADLRVLYRFKVLREPLDSLARESGITPRQMRRRIQQARNRARA